MRVSSAAALRLASALSLASSLALSLVSCGGTEEQARPEEKEPLVFPPDPGSGPTDCSIEADYEFVWIEDWETGAGTGWYTNNEYCQRCADIENATDLIIRPLQCLNGLATGCTAEEKRTSAQQLLENTEASDEELDEAIAEVVACYEPMTGVFRGSCEGDSTLFADLLEQTQATAVEVAELNAEFVSCVAECDGTQSPGTAVRPVPASQIPGGRCGSQMAVHIEAPYLERRGGTLGRQFSAASPFDASEYEGVAFWFRVAPGSRNTLRLSVPEAHTEEKSLDEAGNPVCIFVSPHKEFTDKSCDKFGKVFLATTDWQLVRIPFDEMRQAGFGKQAPFFDISQIFGLSLDYKEGSWSLWVDDVGFYRKR